MLTQQTMNVESVLNGNDWKVTVGNINTWKRDWTYRDNIGIETTPTQNSQKIWRKHKNFILNKPLSITTNNYFNDVSGAVIGFDWLNGIPVADKWKKVSETTRYNHFSSPVESKDINNNFAASKMADNDNKVIVSGNSRYTEMYYTGAEYVADSNYFEGEVAGVQFRTDEVAHTGKYALKTTGEHSKLFQIVARSGDLSYYLNPDSYKDALRPGKYKVSFWALTSGNIGGTGLYVNGVEVNLAEKQVAGCWTLLNYYIDIPANTLNDIYVRNDNANETHAYYYDDFRMHPIASSINSYVYDQKTDELVTILDANNLGKTFKYDNAGRLTATYAETVNAPGFNGGFKIVAQAKQNYKGANQMDTQNYPLVINNCYDYGTVVPKKPLSIGVECVNTYETKFKTIAEGSGNYTYQYQYLKNSDNGQYTNFFVGDSIQPIPYAVKTCGANKFDKVWKFNVKVTDNVTGLDYEDNYTYETSGCEFDSNRKTDIQISRCDNSCPNDKFGFKIYPISNSSENNLKYEYAYYTPSLPIQDHNYINVSGSGGSFCPIFGKVASGCKDGFRDYIHLIYKITNLSTNDIPDYVHVIIIGDCIDGSSENIDLKTIDTIAAPYAEAGYIVKLDSKGYLIEKEPLSKVIK